MSPHNYHLKRGTALVIAGPQGCGKSLLARQIAMGHGKFQQIETGPAWDFQLRDALNGRPDVLIVDGVPGRDELADIKCMVTSSQVLVRQPRTSLRVNQPSLYRPSPFVILCTMNTDWIQEGNRRFAVIDLTSKEVAHV